MDLKLKIGFMITTIASLIIFLISLSDILFLQERFTYWFFTSILLFLITLLLFVFMHRLSKKKKDPVFLFEKTLHGGLYHFKCSRCNGVFALKESKKNDIRQLTLTCPDCGAIGQISSKPPVKIDHIPSKKSPRISFVCKKCGETLNIWAEGRPLSDHISIFSCPYCGNNKPMKPIS